MTLSELRRIAENASEDYIAYPKVRPQSESGQVAADNIFSAVATPAVILDLIDRIGEMQRVLRKVETGRVSYSSPETVWGGVKDLVIENRWTEEAEEARECLARYGSQNPLRGEV